VVPIEALPLSVHGLGVYHRRFFGEDTQHFQGICAEHTFQALTESNKPGTAHRTGIYLTPVEREGSGLRFRLLRCSTNLAGPTENFRASDRAIVDALNQAAAFVFEGHAPLNHVLAQLYHNTASHDGHKQAKARISAHADKTKDMPADGVMAFCTFYDGLDGLRPLQGDRLDYGYKEVSALTRLRFRRKEVEGASLDPALPQQFSVVLYPNSVFFMPLSTNRLYTHEIQPSQLDAGLLPTRLGYVVRCSKAEALHQGGQTFLARGGGWAPLEPPTQEGVEALRALYAAENRQRGRIAYGDQFGFSMNQGDYLAPQRRPQDAFRVYDLPRDPARFAALSASVAWEELGKGRQGAVLTLPDEARGVPLVRTTTRYHAPAQVFGAVHARLARLLQRRASLALDLNHALIERYTRAYATLGAHCDQALDLEEASDLVLFSCYEHPTRADAQRKLVVEPKDGDGEGFELPLRDHSAVVFSVEANRRFKHKIVLDDRGAAENVWLGVTFRTAKTFARYLDGRAQLGDGSPLVLADEAQQGEFFRLRHRENAELGFAYPPLGYTISPSDLVPPA
jgi:hypothetical protein